MQANKSYDAFAVALGQNQRKTLEATLVWHKAFGKATPELQGEMRVRWLTGFVQGYLGKTEAQAAKIVAQSRTERSVETQKAYDAGRHQFSYHIIRKASGKGEAGAAVKAKAVRIAATERAAWDRFVKAVGAERAAIVATALMG